MDGNSLHPTFQESLAVGLNLKIYHLNIECKSGREHEIDIVAIQI
jgi:hypothetical protein